MSNNYTSYLYISGKLFKDPVLNKKPVLHLGFANSLIHLASAFFLISASYLQIATWAGTVLNCKGLGNSGDQPTLHNSYVNNDCLNNPSLRLISPNQDVSTFLYWSFYKSRIFFILVEKGHPVRLPAFGFHRMKWKE